ncbi:hypothetical protein ACS15_3764 [Ralstonia insidiosa]|uniref:Surface antigen domain-containing protein n=1 Tax=Ralstonia insidiosa TaxID=190721 RepID=A0AAC9BKP9_9RALS|nr:MULTISPECIES: hypothetical protein [Ralstonia]ANH74704.1 hypothetical protein ACS15_3764 [Ralstonia insidiosa]EPX95380.1 hypothetical protein C404_23645 [Ralstonia sp. AU12-08]MBY4708012.1 hypothetical protein [Ralstonia insidiosa]GAQ28637.1 hypothetical protein SAMD00023378_2320 [Ralstonia sp. NT80]
MLLRRLPARRFALALTGAALLAAATPSFAYFRNVLASTIIGSMSETEVKSFTKAIGSVLVNTADNTPAQWTWPAKGKQPAIEATITPLESKTDAGQACRRLQSELTRGSSKEQWTAWLCKQPSGEWKLRRLVQ